MPSSRTLAHKDPYDSILAALVSLLDRSRRAAAQSVNAIMTSTYWLIGKRIVDGEQQGKRRAGYGQALIERLSIDLTARLGRGFSARNLEQMRRFYLSWPKPQTPSAVLTSESSAGDIPQTVSALSDETVEGLGSCFPLPWSHYVKLLSINDDKARRFYESEAIRGDWAVRQLIRHIDSQFYQRTLLSKNKAAMLRRGKEAKPEDIVSVEEQVKDPYVLEFLNLKDEYSENDLDSALVSPLESFLLELGGDFAFIGRSPTRTQGRCTCT